MSLKVIVSGAGVAGLSLAHWLGRIARLRAATTTAPSALVATM